MVTSAVALIAQSTRLMGLEILILAVPVLAVTVSKQVIQRRQSRSDPLAWTISGAVSIGIATVPCTVAGVLLIEIIR